jgi:hypothetical protein
VFLYCVLKRVFEEVEIEKCYQCGSHLKSVVREVHRRKLFGKLFSAFEKQKFEKFFFFKRKNWGGHMTTPTTYVLLGWPRCHPYQLCPIGMVMRPPLSFWVVGVAMRPPSLVLGVAAASIFWGGAQNHPLFSVGGNSVATSFFFFFSFLNFL